MTEQTVSAVDIEALRRAVADSGGDDAFVAELMSTFTVDLDRSLGALRTAVQRRDAVVARRLAHRIKGGAAAIRAAALRAAAEALERARDAEELERCAARVVAEAARAVSALAPKTPEPGP